MKDGVAPLQDDEAFIHQSSIRAAAAEAKQAEKGRCEARRGLEGGGGGDDCLRFASFFNSTVTPLQK